LPHLFLKEYFADYAPLLPSLFSLNHVPTEAKPLFSSSPNAWDPKALELAVQGVSAVLLSLKKKPVIRYEKMSGMARKLAIELQVYVLIGILSCAWLTPPSLFCSTVCNQNRRCLTSGSLKSPHCYLFSIGETTQLPHFYRNGHTKQWFMSFWVSRTVVSI